MVTDGYSSDWNCDLIEEASDASEYKAKLQAALPHFVESNGDSTWGMACIPVERMKAAIMADAEIADSWASWEDYSKWYMAGGVGAHSNEDRCASLLSNHDDETLQDGWHRLHCYIAAGNVDVPVVFFPQEHHLLNMNTCDADSYSACEM